MKPFAFRQRVGPVNWKAISSVDIEAIIDDNKIEELQSIVDDVAFCEVKTTDVKGTGIHDLKRLIHLMQLMIEYLLYCQEAQLQLVHEMHARNGALKNKNKELLGKVESSKEDIRIYRRQISVLKNSIDKYKAIIDKNDGNVELPPRAFNVLHSENLQPKSDNTAESVAPIVESMLRHERQTREFVREMIDEQRSTLLREIDLMHKMSRVPDRVQSTQPVEVRPREAPPTRRDSESSEYEEKRRFQKHNDEHRARERQLLDRIHDLEMQTKQYEDKLASVASRSSEVAGSALITTKSVGVNTPPLATVTEQPTSRDRGVALAFNTISRYLIKGDQSLLAHAFRHLKQRYLIRIANSKKTLQNDLLASRSNEKMLEEKVTILLARLESEKEQHRALQTKTEAMAQQIANMSRQQQQSTKTQGSPFEEYRGPSEAQLLREALQRVHSRVVEASAEDVLDTLADEILDRVEIAHDLSDSSQSIS